MFFLIGHSSDIGELVLFVWPSSDIGELVLLGVELARTKLLGQGAGAASCFLTHTELGRVSDANGFPAHSQHRTLQMPADAHTDPSIYIYTFIFRISCTLLGS